MLKRKLLKFTERHRLQITMVIDESLLQSSEKITLALRGLFKSSGYEPYRMSKFEEYDLYASNKDFLISDNVITFTDTDGKLMALKPDVTLSIIKNSSDDPDSVNKIFYSENVYRVSKGSGSFREITQTGAECIGNVSDLQIAQILKLAAESLKLISKDSVLAISDIEITDYFINRLHLPGCLEAQLRKALSEKSVHEIRGICSQADCENGADDLIRLLSVNGSPASALIQLEDICKSCEPFERFRRILKQLTEDPDLLTVDFSVSGDTHYYNGIIFKGFVKNIPTYVLSGGQYDRLMRKLGKRSKAIGFAVYTDELDRLETSNETANSSSDWLNIALPKGRLGEKVCKILEKAGYECPSQLNSDRKLVLENPQKKIRYFQVKPSDVAIYVERGAADLGICGKDILLEYSPDIFELLDLGIGKCRMAVAAPKGFSDKGNGTLKIATKYENVAKSHFRSKGRPIDVIHLNGSIELAPILGLSDVIVDIVETGTTLRENDLEVTETVFPISARLIAGKAASNFKKAEIEKLLSALKTILSENTEDSR